MEQIENNFSGEELIPIFYFKDCFQEIDSANICIIVCVEMPKIVLRSNVCLICIRDK